MSGEIEYLFKNTIDGLHDLVEKQGRYRNTIQVISDGEATECSSISLKIRKDLVLNIGKRGKEGIYCDYFLIRLLSEGWPTCRYFSFFSTRSWDMVKTSTCRERRMEMER
jgi:hypothetical protein